MEYDIRQLRPGEPTTGSSRTATAPPSTTSESPLTEYAINTNAWILRAPKRQVSPGRERRASFRAPNCSTTTKPSPETTSGIVTIGNLTLRRDWIDPANATAFVKSARTKYDTYGNPIAIFDPLADGTGNPVRATSAK